MPHLSGTDGARAIGGVFAAAVPADAIPGDTTRSLWDHWSDGAGQVLTFRNARSALAHLLEQRAPRCLWLPAYGCAELGAAARATGTPLRFFGGSPALEPDIPALNAALRPGDLVLAIAHFGRPAPGLRDLAARRTDVIWVEDCAQTADTAVAPWAAYRLYSPRKLLGVADGGLLVDRDGVLPPLQAQSAAATARLRHAGLLRRHDPADRRNALWYAAFRRAEAAMTVSDHAMSPLTLQVLRRTPLAPLCSARKRNYARLHRAMAALALWPDPTPDWTPLGFPVRVPNAAALGESLARHRIFAPRHWARLTTDSPPAAERALSQQLLTLPCDQRYSEADMDRLIAAVQACLP